MSLNPVPLTLSQVWALGAVAARELGWVLPNVKREVRTWRQMAERIPDPALRADALGNLVHERLNIEGAALFAVLPRRFDYHLLRVLVAYQVLLDYLDTTSERLSTDPVTNGTQLHMALTDALDPARQIADHYLYHRWQDDGGYVRALIETCRMECLALPSFPQLRADALRAARLTTVQALNHEPDEATRNAALAAWASREFAPHPEVSWFELTAAASSSLWLYAVLALAAERHVDPADVTAARDAYLPWICAASTFLDSYVDQVEDRATGSHSYVAHYPTHHAAARRLETIVAESAARARGLRRGTRHALITTGMVAMYLSDKRTSDPALREVSHRILRRAGSLPRVQVPILRALRLIQRRDPTAKYLLGGD